VTFTGAKWVCRYVTVWLRSNEINQNSTLQTIIRHTLHPLSMTDQISVRETKEKYSSWQNKTDCRDTTTEVWAIINCLYFGHNVNRYSRIYSAVVPIHWNNWCVRSTTLQWFQFTGITALLEAQIWNDSYSQESLVCYKQYSRMVPIHTNHSVRSTTMEWVLFTGITVVRNKTLEWFLFTGITALLEAKL
jgi:hypothetical protein